MLRLLLPIHSDPWPLNFLSRLSCISRSMVSASPVHSSWSLCKFFPLSREHHSCNLVTSLPWTILAVSQRRSGWIFRLVALISPLFVNLLPVLLVRSLSTAPSLCCLLLPRHGYFLPDRWQRGGRGFKKKRSDFAAGEGGPWSPPAPPTQRPILLPSPAAPNGLRPVNVAVRGAKAEGGGGGDLGWSVKLFKLKHV